MEDMKKEFIKHGLEVPQGLVNLIETSADRHSIYRKLWAATKFGAGIGETFKTYVFPEVVRTAIREKYPEGAKGAYDTQYTGRDDVYYVSIEEMTLIPYPKMKAK